MASLEVVCHEDSIAEVLWKIKRRFQSASVSVVGDDRFLLDFATPEVAVFRAHVESTPGGLWADWLS